MRERRDVILDVAVRLWREHGEGFTMEELVKESEVPRAALYRLFSKKSEVLLALANERGLREAAEEQPEISEKIIKAAQKVFMQEGLHATLERVAEVAGVGVATIYRRFKDKNGLFKAISDENPARRATRELELSSDGDPTEQLTMLVTRLLEALPEFAPTLLMLASGAKGQQELFKSLKDRQDRTYRVLARYLSGLMEKGILRKAPPEECAVALIGMCIMTAYLGPSLAMVEFRGAKEHAPLIVSLFLRGLASGETQGGPDHDQKT